MIQSYLAVMAGGALGSAARLFLSQLIASQWGQAFPWGTIIVNITGSFVIGLFVGLTGPDGAFPSPPVAREFVAIGILGGYTTFSSFSLQTVNLIADGEVLHAVANVTLSIVLCLTATWVGLLIAAIAQPK